MKNKIGGIIMLSTATLIWGTSLVAQSIGMAYLEPFTFNAVRFAIGAFILTPFITVRSFLAPVKCERSRRLSIRYGTLCGIVLFITASLQQIGLSYTTVGKAGFITALYIIIVPILSLFEGKKIQVRLWLCTFIATAGMFLLCINEKISLGFGDTLVLLCSFSTAIHILLIDRYLPQIDGVTLSCIQFLICSILSFISAFAFEHVGWEAVYSARIPVLYTGVLSCGVAYTLQILGQQYVPPVLAALIFSFESVFSALFGWMVLGEALSARELSGCISILAAIVIAQLPMSTTKKGFHPLGGTLSSPGFKRRFGSSLRTHWNRWRS